VSISLDKFVRQLSECVTTRLDELVPTARVGNWSFEVDHVVYSKGGPVIVASVSPELEELSALWLDFMTAVGAGQVIRDGKPSLWNFMQWLQDNLSIETQEEAAVFLDTVQSGGEGRQVRRSHEMLKIGDGECSGANDGTCPKHPFINIDAMVVHPEDEGSV
jgi:hypothetical protein